MMNARARAYLDADDAQTERIVRGNRIRAYGPAFKPLPRTWLKRGMTAHQRMIGLRWFKIPTDAFHKQEELA